MPDYLARVEIFRANSEEYVGLHEGMEALGLKRTIEGQNAMNKLPIGTYYGYSDLDTQDLSKRVLEVARPFSLPSEPLVIVSQSLGWAGWLEPV
ncbi:hypothetical protein N5C70_15195 [Pseudomonas juntendi]|uniref:Uncharacterized protein n=1 Tax=Pseudomonas juntendi TaxID=2666183 RepID=A0ABD4YEX9_9PSED|nr:hypothetical protein [Pseudomonas juntendi]MDH0758046.1 hypothetical protein [Pseudomonas juntendi]MDH1919546.1 hypothetical protein [Pseudomonas juntendi]